MIATVGLIFFLTLDIRQAPDPGNVLPSDTIALLKWKNIDPPFQRFQATPFGKKILAPRFWKKMGLGGVCEDARQKVLDIIDSIQAIAPHVSFSILSRKMAAVAILSPEQPCQSLPDCLEHSLVFCTAIQRPAKQQGDQLRFRGTDRHIETMYGIEVHMVPVEGGRKVYFALIDDLMLGSLQRGLLLRCLNAYSAHLVQPSRTLAGNSGYVKLLQHASRDEVCSLYLNPFFIKQIGQAVGFRAMQRGTFFGPETRLLLQYHEKADRRYLTFVSTGIPDNKVSFLNKYFPAKPLVHQRLERLDSRVSGYLWTNWFDVEKLWQGLSDISDMETAASLFYIEQAVLRRTGMRMETLMALLDNELGVFIADFPTAAFASLPVICLQLKVKDKRAVRRLLRKILADVPMRSRVVGGTPAISLVLANGLIEPTYLFYDEYLIVADNAELIEYWMGTCRKKLVDSMAFKKVSHGLRQANNLIFYTRSDQVNSGLEKMLQLLTYTLQGADRISPEQGAFIRNELLQPLFNSVQNVRSQSIRVVQQQNVLLGAISFYVPGPGQGEEK
ncbi:MAG: hypothetical protein CSA33_06330 [Desulfobulbus propionicus]|nr:MAG: hypothetical protein CSA33_06330 [Desulfobulbus propionicus]